MGSTRLPGKSMMNLAGAPLVARILERVKRSRTLDTIVLATTGNPEDEVLADLASACGVECFRGSSGDLVDRYYQAARRFAADTIVRLPADNPVVEPGEIDRIVEFHLAERPDFSSNTHNILDNGYPDGLGAEVFDVERLEYVWRVATDPRNREHPHTYFYEHPELFRIGTVKCPAAFSRPDLVLDVNTREEYEFIRAIYEHLYPKNAQFHITDIIEWYDTVYCADKPRG